MQTKKACILGCLSHHHVLICFFLLKFETFYNAAYLLMENGFRQFNDFHPSWKPSNPSTFKKSSPHYIIHHMVHCFSIHEQMDGGLPYQV